MQKTKKIAVIAGLAGLVGLGTLGSLALADGGPGDGMGCGMRHGMGRGMGPGGAMMARHLIQRYDANKDGKVSQEEIDTNRTQWLAEFDADKNGTLSLEEFEKLWLKARFERMVREFQRFDRDGNGQVTLDEYKDPTADLVANGDRNDDGFLSREDRPQRGEGRGWRHGKNDDRMPQGPGMDDDDDGRDDAPPPADAPDDAQ